MIRAAALTATLALPRLAPAPAVAPAALSPAAPLAVPALAPSLIPAAAPAAPLALTPALPFAPASPALDARVPAETAAAEAAARFDGSAFAKGEGPAPVPAADAGWTAGSFESDAGGVRVAYKRRAAAAPGRARVHFGGLALNEGFDSLFLTRTRAAGTDYFAWTRGHPPTAWVPTKAVLDADARDLARAILLAARESPDGRVDLALHSFGTLVFQSLVQLRAEPEAAAALSALRGARVVMLNATTHYEGSEKKAGPAFERMGQATKAFVDGLDSLDSIASSWRALGEANPFLRPQIEMLLAQWRVQREYLLDQASRGAANMMRADLREPWAPGLEGLRREFLAALERNAREPGWQEALLRRSADMFRLEFSRADARALRALGAKITLVHSAGDALLNWESARVLFGRLGVKAPRRAPPAGTILRDRAGVVEALIVDGDHYFPLKKPRELAEVLDR